MPIITVQRCKNNSQVRTSEESHSVICCLAISTGMQNTASTRLTLEDILRGCIFFVMSNQSIQRRLLAEKDLTYEKAYKLVKSIEADVKGSKTNALDKLSKTTRASSSSVHYNAS